MSPPWMPLYVADYLADTGHLGAAEHGAYLLLIMQYWQKGSLPNDDRQLARIARMTDRAWTATRPVMQQFFAEGWKHTRIERELAKAEEKNTRRVEAGKAGGFAKHKAGKRTSIATGNATSNALASSSQPQSEEDTSLRSVSPARAPRTPKSVKSQIADDAQPDDRDREHAASVGMSPDVFRFEWQRYRDHHLKCASKMANWSAAWRTWCANWLERGGGSRSARAGPAPPRSGDGIEDARRMLRERMNGGERDHHTEGGPGAGAANAGDAPAHGGAAQQARAGRHDERWRDGHLLDLVVERPH